LHMLSYWQALEMILNSTSLLEEEYLPVTAAYGRILATALVAPHDIPLFAQSLVDGYAVRSADTRAATPGSPVGLTIGQTLTAGEVLQQPLPSRQAIRIMTGAPMPLGANAVLKLEDSQTEAGALVLPHPVPQGLNVQQRGAEIRRRTVVIQQGERLTPQRIGTALSLGIDTVAVIRQPRIAFVAPGNELLPPGAPLAPGKKWCSNLYALELRAQELGCISVNLGIIADTLAALTECLRQGLACEAVVILGASGRGDHDFAAQAMTAVGAQVLFRGVATSPGRTITVAQHQRTLIFGLPGSPWAAFIGFEVFVWPALRALLGQRPTLPPTRDAMLTAPLQVHRGVTHFLPARLQQRGIGWQAAPVANLLALARAESEPLGLIMVPPHRRRLSPGDSVHFQMITF
jgi:molybdenum cofactor synthesis domain-containing protein